MNVISILKFFGVDQMILSKVDAEYELYTDMTHLYDYWWIGCKDKPLITFVLSSSYAVLEKLDGRYIYIEVLWGRPDDS